MWKMFVVVPLATALILPVGTYSAADAADKRVRMRSDPAAMLVAALRANTSQLEQVREALADARTELSNIQREVAETRNALKNQLAETAAGLTGALNANTRQVTAALNGAAETTSREAIATRTELTTAINKNTDEVRTQGDALKNEITVTRSEE